MKHFAGDPDDRPLRKDLSVDILAVGGYTEVHDSFIRFVRSHDIVGKLGSATDQNNQQSCGHGVQRAAVADFFELEQLADAVHDIVRGRAGRLVDEQDAIQRIPGFPAAGG